MLYFLSSSYSACFPHLLSSSIYSSKILLQIKLGEILHGVINMPVWKKNTKVISVDYTKNHKFFFSLFLCPCNATSQCSYLKSWSLFSSLLNLLWACDLALAKRMKQKQYCANLESRPSESLQTYGVSIVILRTGLWLTAAWMNDHIDQIVIISTTRESPVRHAHVTDCRCPMSPAGTWRATQPNQAPDPSLSNNGLNIFNNSLFWGDDLLSSKSKVMQR